MLSAWRVRGLHLDGPSAVPELAVRRLGRRVVWVALNLTTGEVLDDGVASKLIAALVTGEGAADLDRDAAFKSFEVESDRWSATVKHIGGGRGHTWRRLPTGVKFAEKRPGLL